MNLNYFKKLILKSRLSNYLSTRRYFLLNKIYQPLLEKNTSGNIKVLEVGCAQGKDFIRHSINKNYELIGVDIDVYTDRNKNFEFIQSDASKLPFKNDSFDLVISIGMLEHITTHRKTLSGH